MLCRLGRNDRPCSGARLAEAGSEALGDSSSSLRIVAVTLQQQVSAVAGLGGGTLAVVTALWAAAGPVTKRC